ncbi:hypothetical protein [Mycolicibacterium sp.]|uniref:hypothetical protein n=1 Tax=Mycolicibacterium sp. TaxID=2320850 RepID=UPI0037C81340
MTSATDHKEKRFLGTRNIRLEKLLRTDQRTSVLPLRDEGDLIAPLLFGVAWGFASMLVGLLALTRRRRDAHDINQMTAATGRVIEIHPSGLAHARIEGQSLAIWHLIVRVDPPGEEPFLGVLATDDDTIQVGDAHPVRYRPEDPDVIYAADEATVR